MRYFLIILFVLLGATLKAQVPTGLPQVFGGSFYEFKKYVLIDSMMLMPCADTSFTPIKPALIYKCSDSTFYLWTQSRWTGVTRSIDLARAIAQAYNNIYNMDSTLSSNRTVTQSGRYLRFKDGIPYTRFDAGKMTIQPDSAGTSYSLKEILPPFGGGLSGGMLTWYEGLGFATQTPSRPNYPYIRGWNLSAGGGLVSSNVPALGESWEPNYRTDPVTGTPWLMEKHILYVTPQGNQRRLESYTINTTTNLLQLYHTVLGFDLRDTLANIYLSSGINITNKTSTLSLISKGVGAGTIITADSINNIVGIQPANGLSNTDLQMNQWRNTTLSGNALFNSTGFQVLGHIGAFSIIRNSSQIPLQFMSSGNMRGYIRIDEGTGTMDYQAQAGYAFRFFPNATLAATFHTNGSFLLNATASSTNITSRKLYVAGSVGLLPDSTNRNSTLGARQLVTIDTTTGRVERLPMLTATATLDFGSTAAGAKTDLTMTLTGAVVGDLVILGVPNGSVPANGVFFGWVSATDTVSVRYINNDLVATLDPASGTFRASVIKQ